MTIREPGEQDIHRLVRFVGLNTVTHPFVTFCVSVIVARALGPDGRGEYGVLVATIGTLPLVIEPGLSYAARFWGAAGRADPPSLLKTITLAGLLLAALLSCLVMGGWWADLPLTVLPRDLGSLGIAALALTLCLTTLTRLWTFFLAGQERYAYSTWANTGAVGLQAVILLLVWQLAEVSLDLAAVALAMQAFFLFALFPLLSGMGLRDLLAAPLLSASTLRQMLAYGLWPYLSGLLAITNIHVVVFLVSGLAGFYETGLYTAVAGPAALLLLFGAPLNLVLPARTTRRIGNPDFPRQVAVALRLVLCLTAGAAVLGVLVAPLVIPWIFGARFEGAVLPFQILLPGAMALAFKNIIIHYLTGLGRPRRATAITAITATITLGLCLLLLPDHGAVGAALAVTTAHLCSAAFGTYSFLRLSDLRLRQVLRFRLSDWTPLLRVLGFAPRG